MRAEVCGDRADGGIAMNVPSLAAALIGCLVTFGSPLAAEERAIPSLIGTWSGQNNTIGNIFGLRSRPRTVEITEQTDRRFRGHFVYEGGRVDFFGIVFPDDVSFAWVSTSSKGSVQGRILAPDRIAACYVEGGAEATAGCSDLTRAAP
ncbi:MAG: hypothetical protein NW217_16010 [Hyphomicrobiaceae bacterium]|nr:hypothetical protein [Hyphomicrobiaceae bacterium]